MESNPPIRAVISALVFSLLVLSGCSVNRAGQAEDGAGTESARVLGQTEGRKYLYVAPNGDDSNSGTDASHPLRTVSEGAERLDGMGGTIELLPGTYGSQSVIGVSGAARSPIVIKSTNRQAVLTSSRYDGGQGIHVKDSEHIVIEGLVARKSLWGMQIESSKNVTLIDNLITDTGQEAVHIFSESSFVDVIDNEISQTGQRSGSHSNGTPYNIFGEGIYVGCGNCPNDTTHDIRIRGNDISDTASEAIDLKPHTYNLIVEANQIHDIATSTSGAVVLGIGVRDYPDPNAVIRNNMIWNISRTSRWTDGNAISLSAPATVYNNVIWNTEHRGILVDSNFVNRDARQVHIFHNTITNTGLAGIDVWRGGNDAIATVEANIGTDLPGNLLANPSWFADASSNDYRLNAAVPAIDAATAVLVGYDAQGFPRPQGRSADMGAYEFGSPAPTQALPQPAVPAEVAGRSPVPATTTPPVATPSGPASPLVRDGVPPQPKPATVAANSRFADTSESLDGSSDEIPLGDAAALSPTTSAPVSEPSRSSVGVDKPQSTTVAPDVPAVAALEDSPERAIGVSDQEIVRPEPSESSSAMQEVPSELAYPDVVINPGEQIPGDARFASPWLLLAGVTVLALGAAVGLRRKRLGQSA